MNKTLSDKVITEFTDVETLYGKQNLADWELFAGGFINFGYWKNLKFSSKISEKTRILSSQRLYEKVFDLLAINNLDKVLEIGSGLGNGCVLLHKTYHPKYVIGIDASYEQIQRTIKKHEKYLKDHIDDVKFFISEAENIQIPSGSITKAFSVEAMQHFKSPDCFLESVFNVLKSQGKLLVTTFFFRSDPPRGFMDLFPNFASGVDKIIKLDEFSKKLEMSGFKYIKSQSIGKYVWEGFDRWISQTEYKDTWDKNWIHAYREGLIDYYIFEAEKP